VTGPSRGAPGLRRGPRIFTVSELTDQIVQTLRTGMPVVWVGGELSGCKRTGPGHLFFGLKDEASQVDAVMFVRYAGTLAFEPADGMDVVVRGRVDLWPQRGRLQLYVDHMEPLGLGALRLAFEQLKERLDAEGLFDPARKRPLPPHPHTVGIVTARQGAAIHDMLRVLGERWPAARVVVYPVRVQGPGAAADIARGIGDLSARRDVDVLIVGRGGGSPEDLWAFNEEPVARAIAAARVPVVSAVGHEIDYTIADFVADVRAATPTAAAALVVPDRREIASHLDHCAQRLGAGLLRCLRVAQARLEGLARRLGDPRRRVVDLTLRVDDLSTRARQALVRRVAWDRRELVRLMRVLHAREPRRLIAGGRLRVRGAAERLGAAMRRRASTARATVQREGARLGVLSPLACLARGYAIVRRETVGAPVVRDAGTLVTGEAVTLVLARGRAKARIDSTET
jgi:exodeoxyribonuclease VII large subunit